MKKARIAMILDYPFFGNIGLSIKLIENYNIRTANINSERLQYNPDFVAMLDSKERLFLYLHEICHVILCHPFRRNGRNKKIWDIACGYAVNLLVKDVLKQKMPAVGLYNLKYKDMSAEAIYDELMSEYEDALQMPEPMCSQDDSDDPDQGEEGSDQNEEGSDQNEEGSDQGEEGSDQNEEGSDQNEEGSDQNEEGSDQGEEGSDQGGNTDEKGSDQAGVSGEEGSDQNDGQGKDGSDQAGGKGEEDHDQAGGPGEDGSDKAGDQDRIDHELERKAKELEEMFEEAQRNGMVEDAPLEESEHSTQAKIVAAQRVTEKQAGASGTPEQIRKLVKRFVNTKLNWRALLANFLSEACQSRYNWMIPNQRYSFNDIIMPTLKAQEAINMVIAIDTSGSIDERELQAFFDEVNVLTASFEYEAIHIVSCDTKIHNPKKFLKYQPIDYEAIGGGGSHTVHVWDWIKKESLTPACVLYFTDLEIFSGFWGEDPGYPVLWIGKFWNQNKKVPFGQKVMMEIN